jgi:hypothetical protein
MAISLKEVELGDAWAPPERCRDQKLPGGSTRRADRTTVLGKAVE